MAQIRNIMHLEYLLLHMQENRIILIKTHFEIDRLLQHYSGVHFYLRNTFFLRKAFI